MKKIWTLFCFVLYSKKTVQMFRGGTAVRKEFYYLSKDQETQIYGMEWIPEGQVKAVLQISHGMVEHIARYDEFAGFLAEKGIYVVGNSHLGHGKSVTSQEKLGYFHDPDGNECVLGDIQELRKITQEKYPSLPYFMLGHSMGSFLLRQYLGRYGEGLTGAVIMGTGDQPGIVLKLGKTVCRTLAFFKGWDMRCSFVNEFVVGGYEKKLGKSWISRNEENVKAYTGDPFCNFVFTLNAFYHMFDGMQKMNVQERKGKVPKELPIFFMAGKEDLVGNKGKGVEKVYRRYVAQGMTQVKIKLYEEDRHEILNETDREMVYQDIWQWIQKILAN